MPKNVQGGSKHKKGSNSESSTSKKNKKLFDNLLSDIYGDEDIGGIHIGRVAKKLGDGRMEVEYFENGRLETVKALMKGSIRGRGKKDAWVDLGAFVILNETGVMGTMAFEIVMPLDPHQVARLKKEGLVDEHFFEKTTNGGDIEFEAPEKKEEEEKEINIDNI
jgi:hypothetical protein